jgi:hypothetical protein
MNSTITFSFDPRSAVPSEGRAAWLEKYGVPADNATVTLTAPLALWERASHVNGLYSHDTLCDLNTNGTVFPRNPLLDDLRAVCRDTVRKTGAAPSELHESILRSIVEAIEAKHAERAKAKAEDEARREAERVANVDRVVGIALATPDSAWIDTSGEAPVIKPLYACPVPDFARSDARIVARHADLVARLPQIREEHARVKAERETALGALVREHGTPSQSERFADGVLPEEELRDLARDAWLPLLDGIQLYSILTVGDIVHDDDCYTPTHKFSSDACTGPWTAQEWDVLQTVRRAYEPIGATVTPREHRGYCESECCTHIAQRYGVRATISRHGVTVSREYALPSA